MCLLFFFLCLFVLFLFYPLFKAQEHFDSFTRHVVSEVKAPARPSTPLPDGSPRLTQFMPDVNHSRVPLRVEASQSPQAFGASPRLSSFMPVDQSHYIRSSNHYASAAPALDQFVPAELNLDPPIL